VVVAARNATARPGGSPARGSPGQIQAGNQPRWKSEFGVRSSQSARRHPPPDRGCVADQPQHRPHVLRPAKQPAISERTTTSYTQ
jgi:hypothetical protein